jgi:catechol 2,3-dioxygenase-like lactoylglutathione lyase family enzyme
VRDPNGYPVAVSTDAFGVGDERRGVPGIRHVAFAIPATDRVLDFYTRVFGLRELPTSLVRRRQQFGNRFAGDGCTNLALHPHPPEPGREPGREPRVGLNHFGFLVPDCAPILDRLGHADHGDYRRPATRPYAEYRIHDPEGNAVDISQVKGWEVDVDRWERTG